MSKYDGNTAMHHATMEVLANNVCRSGPATDVSHNSYTSPSHISANAPSNGLEYMHH